MTDAATLRTLKLAARDADWQQVVLNGGPPCFHFEPERRRFCLRAERWMGHDMPGEDHPFVSLADLLSAQLDEIDRLRAALREITTLMGYYPKLLSPAMKDAVARAQALLEGKDGR